MPRAVDLLKQGRNEELWQMCCGFLKLNIHEFMDIQKRLLMEQLELLNSCAIGKKIMRGATPRTVEEFRQRVPLTTYQDYCPELMEKREETLPSKPIYWVRTSGKSGDYPCKWVPISVAYAEELSKALFGVGLLSHCGRWGDTDNDANHISVLYSVAPRPYISGTFADLLRIQTPVKYLPPLEKAEGLSFDERIKLGFEQAMTDGFGYFFGLSIVLVKVGDKLRESSNRASLRPFLTSPKALWRLGRGKIRSRLAGRPMLPKDLWSLKGIIGSGIDSSVYKDKIKEAWGRNPLDIYSCTEGGVIATQTWDYSGMTFTPHLNFLEFIPEDEQLKWQMDHSYVPRTLLLDEVEAGETYEIVITNYHGGAMIRYRIGDIVRITSLKNEKLGIEIPQMAFERRTDDILDLGVTRLTEKVIWEAIESTGVPYEDWMACKEVGDEMVLRIFIEVNDGFHSASDEIAKAIYRRISEVDGDIGSEIRNDFTNFIGFKVEVSLLPAGFFDRFTAQKLAEGADPAHLKPPHISSPEKVMILITKNQKAEVVPGTETELEQAVR